MSPLRRIWVLTLTSMVVIASGAQSSTIEARAEARFAGDFGMRVELDSVLPAYVEDYLPNVETVSSRFYFKLPAQECLANCSMNLLHGTDAAEQHSFFVSVRKDTLETPPKYEVALSVQYPGYSNLDGIPIELGNWYMVTVRWKSTTGWVSMAVEGIPGSVIMNGLSLAGMRVDSIKVGAVKDHTGLVGPLYIDEYASAETGGFPPITDQLLPAPTLGSPSGQVSDNPPTFNWSAVPGATGYELRIQNADQGFSEIFRGEVTSTSFVPSSLLLLNQDYVWAVRTRSDVGLGPLSNTGMFEMVCGGVGQPVIFEDQFPENDPFGAWTVVEGQ